VSKKKVRDEGLWREMQNRAKNVTSKLERQRMAVARRKEGQK